MLGQLQKLGTYGARDKNAGPCGARENTRVKARRKINWVLRCDVLLDKGKVNG